MALMITDECTSCGACVEDCPNEAISEGDPVYVIDAEKCTECVGFFDEPQCITVCPIECIVPDPAHQETKDELLARKARLHPG